MKKWVYNKEIEVANKEPYVLDLYEEDENMSWYAIYHKDNEDINEWHIKAQNINEALGAFFVENFYATYSEIIDHVELA